VEHGKCLPYDLNGHGTAVAGIVAGNGLVSNTLYKGVAPQADIVGVQVIRDNGVGDTNTILDGMQYIYNNRDRLAIRVACMSFGSNPINPDPIMKGAELLWQAGIVVVASGGNSGPASHTIRSPGATPEILTVGGVDFESGVPKVAKFSSRGPWLHYTRPDIVAPAVDINTTSNNVHYKHMTGTSMSAPIVAGAAALLLSIEPNLTPDAVKQLLLDTTTYVDNDRNASGYGMIDVHKAVQNLQKTVR
jgi:serine protease AprX